MAILRASMVPLSSAPILSQASSERASRNGRSKLALLVGNLDVVEAKLGSRQQDEMDLAADLDLAAEKIGGLGLEDGPVVVPVDEERRREKRAQHHNQHCRQRQAETSSRPSNPWL